MRGGCVFAGYVMPSLAGAKTASLEAVMEERDAARLGRPVMLGQKMQLAAILFRYTTSVELGRKVGSADHRVFGD